MGTAHYLSLLTVLALVTIRCSHGLGEACSGPQNCTNAGEVCGTDKCVCNSSTHYEVFDQQQCLSKFTLGDVCVNPAPIGLIGNDLCLGINVICSSDGQPNPTFSCVCADGYYDNDGTATAGGACILKVGLNGECLQADGCITPNAECSSSTCVCSSNFYGYNNGAIDICDSKISLNDDCTAEKGYTIISNRICSDAIAVCLQFSETNTYKCLCPTDTHVEVEGSCTTVKPLGDTCAQTKECSHITGAVCASLICTCSSTHYDSNGPGANGGTCVEKKRLGEICSTHQDCTSSDTNSECSGGKTCQCKSSYYDNNGTNAGGNCVSKVDLGGGCTQAVSGTATPCNTFNAVCTGSGDSYTCQCLTNYYKSDTNICSQVGTTIGGSCTVPGGETSGNPCSAFNSECTGANSGATGTCSCLTNYYKSAANQCSQMVDLEGTCTAETSGSGDPCKTGFAVCTFNVGSSYTCQCKDGYYKSNTNTCSKEKQLEEDCSTNEDCTSSDTNSVCSGDKCQCQSSYYDDNGNTAGGTCTSMVDLEGTCTAETSGSGDPCKTGFAVCALNVGSSYTCQCQSGYYKSDTNTCSKVGETLGSGCTAPTSASGSTIMDACTISFAECRATSDASSTTCQCTITHYKYGSECRQRRRLGDRCSIYEDCTSVDANSMCSGSTCQCNSTYYDSDGSNNVGGVCTSKVGLGSACPRPDACGAQNSMCSGNNVCICQTSHYDDNGVDATGGVCATKLPLDSSCQQPDACATANSVCLEQKCQCSNNYYDTKQNSRTCNSKHSLNGSCDTYNGMNLNQCIDDKAVCTNINGYQCRCIGGYHEENGQCIANKALGEVCENDSDCSDSAAICPDSNKVCICGLQHYDNNGFAEGGNCQAVSQLQVSSITFSQVDTTSMIVSWTPPSGKGSFINYYDVQWRSNDNTVAGGDKENIKSSTTTSITGLTPGKNYRITVTSVNTVTQVNTPRTTSVSIQRSSKPMPPSSLDLGSSNLDASDQRITLAWTAPSSGVVSRYNVEVLDGTESKQSTSAVGTASATLSFGDIKNGYTYNVKIISKSETYAGSNTEPSDTYVSTFKTVVQAPGPPTEVSCQHIFDEYITLSWNPPQYPNGDLVQYVVNTLLFTTNTEIFQNNTSSTGTTYDVHGLAPGTSYVFQVYTQNERYKSNSAGTFQGFCTTKAKLADEPRNLNFVYNITSRALSVTWSHPDKIYSSENLGYIVQLQDNDANVCVKEIIMRCSNCITGDIQNMDMQHCSQSSQVHINQSEDEIRQDKAYTFQSLLPDTNYTVSVYAVNNAGKGHAASISRNTLEEEPQAPPVNVSVDNIRKTSFNVSWSLIGPRPGQVTYTVFLTADMGADSKKYYVTGYDNTKVFADGLEEYWNYHVTVTAETNVGSPKTSVATQKHRTLPSAPGAVTEFGAVKVELRTDNFHKMTIRWKAPLLLERNSVIKEYVLKHNVGNTTASSGVGEEFKTTSVTSDVFYSQEFDVKPESTYQFEVYAVNTESKDNIGKKTMINETAPAGFPVSIEKANPTLQVVKEGSKDQTFISLNLVREFFFDETNGKVQKTALLGCKSSACPENFIDSAATPEKVDALANWQKAAQNGLYRITKADWLTKNIPERRRRSTYTNVPYTVGTESCDGAPEGTYCNGPLEPETEYIFVAVVCTSTGCTVSKRYGPYITEAVPLPIGMIVGIVVGIAAALVVIVIVLIFLRRRSRNKAPPMSPIPDGSLIDVEIGEKIQKKRPIRLSEFDAYLTKMHKDSNLKFSDEYEDLKTLSPKHPTVASDLEENRAKNRYINIIPFDHSRVKLTTNGEDDKDDYINGNYLPGYHSPREYIGCQGPLPATIDDHWRMIWEQNVTIIVMLTLCKEGQKIKCEQYWPDEVGDPKQYGEVVVEMTSYSNIKTYDFRVFKIRNGSQTRTIKHFHFLTWQDFQANVKHDIILNFIRDVRHQIQPPDKAGPMIVHCSAGVGRTGTYLALDYFMQFIDEHDFDVEIDIFEFVLKMRDSRLYMVQTEQQYVFIHDCVKEMLDNKRLAENNLYENTGGNQDEDLYQNTSQQLYENVQYNSSNQRTEL